MHHDEIGIGPCIVRERLACVDTAIMFSVYFCFFIHCITDCVVLRSDSFFCTLTMDCRVRK